MGGFGFAAREVIRFFASAPELGVEVVCLAGEPLRLSDALRPAVHGARLVPRTRRHSLRAELRQAMAVRRERPDLLLTIDYRRIPTTRLAWVARLSRLLGRPIGFASPAPHLHDRVWGAYGVRIPERPLLPNIIDVPDERIAKSVRPSVVFLGRLDPIKRPWIALELARRLPDVDFRILGQNHFGGPRAWIPAGVPPNVQFLGHIDGTEKRRLLMSAWLLLNSSIHAGLAVSFLEALACRTPLIGSVDPDGVVSRYGIFTGHIDGSGLHEIDRFEGALTALLTDHQRRSALGVAGQGWVAVTHSRARFLASFHRLCSVLGAPGPLSTVAPHAAARLAPAFPATT